MRASFVRGRIEELFFARSLVREELCKYFRRITRKIFLQYFHIPSRHAHPQNLSTIFPQLFKNYSFAIRPRSEEFGASGFAWGRIVEGIIVDKL
jgi:hypothetical protein